MFIEAFEFNILSKLREDKVLSSNQINPLINLGIDELLKKIEQRKIKILNQRKNVTSKLNKLGIKI